LALKAESTRQTIEQPKRASGRSFASVVTRKRPSLNRAAIAFCGILLAMEEWFHGFGALIAFFSPIIILGFVLHRLRGGGYVLGATLG
jgi:hypothetical protein